MAVKLNDDELLSFAFTMYNSAWSKHAIKRQTLKEEWEQNKYEPSDYVTESVEYSLLVMQYAVRDFLKNLFNDRVPEMEKTALSYKKFLGETCRIRYEYTRASTGVDIYHMLFEFAAIIGEFYLYADARDVPVAALEEAPDVFLLVFKKFLKEEFERCDGWSKLAAEAVDRFYTTYRLITPLLERVGRSYAMLPVVEGAAEFFDFTFDDFAICFQYTQAVALRRGMPLSSMYSILSELETKRALMQKTTRKNPPSTPGQHTAERAEYKQYVASLKKRREELANQIISPASAVGGARPKQKVAKKTSWDEGLLSRIRRNPRKSCDLHSPTTALDNRTAGEDEASSANTDYTVTVSELLPKFGSVRITEKTTSVTSASGRAPSHAGPLKSILRKSFSSSPKHSPSSSAPLGKKSESQSASELVKANVSSSTVSSAQKTPTIAILAETEKRIPESVSAFNISKPSSLSLSMPVDTNTLPTSASTPDISKQTGCENIPKTVKSTTPRLLPIGKRFSFRNVESIASEKKSEPLPKQKDPTSVTVPALLGLARKMTSQSPTTLKQKLTPSSKKQRVKPLATEFANLSRNVQGVGPLKSNVRPLVLQRGSVDSSNSSVIEIETGAEASSLESPSTSTPSETEQPYSPRKSEGDSTEYIPEDTPEKTPAELYSRKFEPHVVPKKTSYVNRRPWKPF